MNEFEDEMEYKKNTDVTYKYYLDEKVTDIFISSHKEDDVYYEFPVIAELGKDHLIEVDGARYSIDELYNDKLQYQKRYIWLLEYIGTEKALEIIKGRLKQEQDELKMNDDELIDQLLNELE